MNNLGATVTVTVDTTTLAEIIGAGLAIILGYFLIRSLFNR